MSQTITTSGYVTERRAAGEIMLSLGAVLILAAFAIDLGAGRWGAYIRSPIPGLYLPDLLLAVGALTAVPYARRLAEMRWLLVGSFALVALYLAVRGFGALFWNPVPERYLAIRDLAPFAYLTLVPLLAIALRRVPWVAFLWIIRVAASLHLIGYTLSAWGLITVVPSPLLGADFISLFEYRGDLLGVAFGIGFMAWGRWQDSASASRVAQFAFLALGLDLYSRAAFLTFAFCIALAVWRERPGWTFPRISGLLCAGALAALVLPSLQSTLLEKIDLTHIPRAATFAPAEPAQPQQDMPLTPVEEVAVPQAISEIASAAKPQLSIPEALERQLEEGTSGTFGARIQTWAQVGQALMEDRLWLLGAGPGSDVLYTICSQAEAEDGSGLYPGGGLHRPKCIVDSNEAPTILRDPHNWLLNALLYHGVIGTTIFVLAIAVTLWLCRRADHSSLGIGSIGAYFLCGTFGVIISSSFGMLPVAVFLAWLLRTSCERIGPAAGVGHNGDPQRAPH